MERENKFSEKELSQLHALLFVLNNVSRKRIGVHKLSKILYFADQKHLVRYGRTITDSPYLKWDFGPVPKDVYYNILNDIRVIEDNRRSKFEAYLEATGDKKKMISAKTTFDEDELSVSEMNCLMEAIKENDYLSFDELTQKSHKFAWNNTVFNHEINVLDIAREAGATPEQVEFIHENLETRQSRIG